MRPWFKKITEQEWFKDLTDEEREYLELTDRFFNDDFLDGAYPTLDAVRDDFSVAANGLIKLRYCVENNKDYEFWSSWGFCEEMVEEYISVDEYFHLKEICPVEINDINFFNDNEWAWYSSIFSEEIDKIRTSYVEFDGKLLFGRDKDCETVKGSIYNSNAIFNKIANKAFREFNLPKSTLFDVCGMEAIHNLRTNQLKVHGYFTFAGSQDYIDVPVRLSKEEQYLVVKALEHYCHQTYDCSCSERLNKTRKRKKIDDLSGPGLRSLDKAISDAEKQKVSKMQQKKAKTISGLDR